LCLQYLRHYTIYSGNYILRTFRTPSNQSVGSTPTEKIIRRINDAINVMMLDGVAMVITRARDANMAVHTRPDRRESNSVTYKNIIHLYLNKMSYDLISLLNKNKSSTILKL
jgi:hypothetical protein